MKNRFFKLIAILASVLMFSSAAFATQSLLQKQKVQQQLKKTDSTTKKKHAEKAQEGWNKLSDDQQSTLKAKEKEHRSKIHDTRVDQ